MKLVESEEVEKRKEEKKDVKMSRLLFAISHPSLFVKQNGTYMYTKGRYFHCEKKR